jgi:cysteine desulfurase family protein
MLIYLDNATTSYPKPTIISDAIEYSILNFVSPNRSSHELALKSSEALYETRETLANLFNIKDSSHLIFTPGATHSINYVLKGFKWKKNDCIIISPLEHNAVYHPLMTLKKKYDLDIVIMPYVKHKGFDINELEKCLKEKNVRLIALTHASNVTGEVLPVRKTIALAREYGIQVLLDGSQSAGNFSVDISDLDVNYFAFSGHKYLLGPGGTGGLYIKDDNFLEPLIEGGTGLEDTTDKLSLKMPEKFEAGTFNVSSIWALNSSISFLSSEGIENIYKLKKELISLSVDALNRINNITCYSSRQNNVGIISFNINNRSPGEVAMMLDKKYKICVRAGLHCSLQAHHSIGTYPKGCVRASIGCFNSKDDLRNFIKAIKEIAEAI